MIEQYRIIIILCIGKKFSTNHESRLKQARVYRENMQKMQCQYDSILKLHDLILVYVYSGTTIH